MFEVFVGCVGPKLLMAGNCIDHGDGEDFLYYFLLAMLSYSALPSKAASQTFELKMVSSVYTA